MKNLKIKIKASQYLLVFNEFGVFRNHVHSSSVGPNNIPSTHGSTVIKLSVEGTGPESGKFL